MAVTTCALPERGLTLATFSGTVGPADIVQAIHEVFDPRQWRPDFHVCWDARRVQALLLDPEAVDRIVRLEGETRKLKRDGRHAVLVTRELDFIAARLLVERTRRSPVRTARVFLRLDDAAAWIDVRPEVLGRLLDRCADRADERRAA